MTDNVWFAFVYLLIIAPVVTCLLEVPIVRGFKVTSNVKYIILVNLLTNYVLNIGAVLIYRWLGNTAYIVWNAGFEALLIPLSEAFLYKQISDRKPGYIILISYLANAVSFGAGLLLDKLF